MHPCSVSHSFIHPSIIPGEYPGTNGTSTGTPDTPFLHTGSHHLPIAMYWYKKKYDTVPVY